MLNQLITRAYYLNKHLEAPLLEERQEYLKYSSDKGLSRHNLKSIANYLLRIVEFLHLETQGTITLKAIEKAAAEWGGFQYDHPKKKSFSKTGEKRFVWYSIDWLKRIGRLEPLAEERIPLFNRLFERRHALKRHSSAPLLQERLLYLRHLADLEARECTLRNAAQYQLIIMDILNFHIVRTISIDEIEKGALKWAEDEKVRRRKSTCSKFAKGRFVHHAVTWFTMLGCLLQERTPPVPFQEYRDGYLEYMALEQGLSETTVHGRSFLLKDFLINLSTLIQSFATISPSNVDEVLIMKHDRDGCSRRTVQSYASVVRSFLRYAEGRKWCRQGIADSVKSPRVYRHETLPSPPYWDDVKRLLADTRTDDPTDIRDYAILLLLSLYGMRRSEVSGLKLDEIDWKNERIHLRRAKMGRPQTFPLSQSVGEAILRYLKEVRPRHCKSREVFIAMRSPYRALTPGAIYAIVNRRLKPLDLPIAHHGPHALRHACATRLINEGFSLKEIGDHLGHRGPETTRIYTKVDLVNLRKVAEQKWEVLS